MARSISSGGKSMNEVTCVCRNFFGVRIYNHREKKWYLRCAMCGREASGKDKTETLKNWEKEQRSGK